MEQKKVRFVAEGKIYTVDREGLQRSEVQDVAAEDIPGVYVRDDKAYYPLGKQLVPVVGCVFKDGQPVPILDIPFAEDKLEEDVAV